MEARDGIHFKSILIKADFTMADSIAIHGFSKEDTKGWNLNMRTLWRRLFPMGYSENFELIIGNTNLANRIIMILQK